MDDTSTKVLCMVLLFIDTLLFGWPPYLLVKDGNQTPRVARIRKLVISYLTCFAGGVFFGACMLHLLAEGREEMEEYFIKADVTIDFPVFETVVAGGFFTIALIEQIAHRLMKGSADDPHTSLDLKRASLNSEAVNGGNPSTPPKGLDNLLYQTSTVPTVSGDTVSNGVAGVYQPRGMYGAVEVTNSQSTADENTICYKARDANGVPSCDMSGAVISPSMQPSQALEEKRDDEGVGHGHSKDSELVNVAVTIEANPLRAFLLLAALSFHTVFDGLAVGLQTKASNIWEMFAAICIHKSLVALCLGMQLFLVYKSRPVKAFFWVFVFSLISPIGVGLGMILTSGHMNMLAEGLVSWVLQAVATGTFIYVTFFEILWEELLEKRGLLRLCLVIAGFGGMAVAKYVDKG
ncbi:unnamed protein product [Lymnaea stagnalis]|uniref:Uncharacterized protein n=1 Tax=Lymnaea stagnalis TaxID=6523 RepID=A0AAV2GZP0_LYMST